MISTLRNKKGITLVELLATTMISGLVATMVMGLTFFVFKSYQITATASSQNTASIVIVQGITNEIANWGATDMDYANATSTSVTLYRYKYFTDDENGITHRVELPLDNPDTLKIEIVTAGEHQGKLRFTYNGTDERIIDTNFYRFNLTNSFFESKKTSKTAAGVTTDLSYFINLKLESETPHVMSIQYTIPIIIDKPEA